MRCFHWKSIGSSGNWKFALENYWIINNPLIPILFTSILSIIKSINTIIEEEESKLSARATIYQIIYTIFFERGWKKDFMKLPRWKKDLIWK